MLVKNDKYAVIPLPNGYTFESINVVKTTQTANADCEASISQSRRNLFVHYWADRHKECSCYPFVGSGGPSTWIGCNVETVIKPQDTIGRTPNESNPYKQVTPTTHGNSANPARNQAPLGSICHKNLLKCTTVDCQCSNGNKAKCFDYENAQGDFCYVLCETCFNVCNNIIAPTR